MATGSNPHINNLTTLIKRYGLTIPLFAPPSIIFAATSFQKGPYARQQIERLIRVFNRLEAATSRLEDMALAVDSSHADTVAAIQNEQPASAESTSSITATASAPEPLPQSIEDFDGIIEKDVKHFVTLSEKVGGLVEEQVRGSDPTLASTSSDT